jgi:hypothetical protein
MKLIFIYGLPATGKLTVAKELAAKTGYKLFHNHLVVDLLLSTFEFGSEPFVELREEIWLSVFDKASRSGLPGMIFTFAPEKTVRSDFVKRMMDVVTGNGGQVNLVALLCPLEEIRNRIDDPSRLEHRKLSSLELFNQLHDAGVFDTSQMPMPDTAIDTSLVSPVEAAEQIMANLNLS